MTFKQVFYLGQYCVCLFQRVCVCGALRGYCMYTSRAVPLCGGESDVNALPGGEVLLAC